MPHRIERAAVQPVGERVIHQPVRYPQQPRVVQLLQPVALERAEIVGIAEFAAQLLENLPVPVARGRPMLDAQMNVEVGLHAIVVEQRVVDVEQERRGRGIMFGHLRRRLADSATARRRRSAPRPPRGPSCPAR